MSANNVKNLNDEKKASRAPFEYLMNLQRNGNVTEEQIAELHRLLNAAPAHNVFTDDESKSLKAELEKSGAIIIRKLK
jgi:hypothetical protein